MKKPIFIIAAIIIIAGGIFLFAKNNDFLKSTPDNDTAPPSVGESILTGTYEMELFPGMFGRTLCFSPDSVSIKSLPEKSAGWFCFFNDKEAETKLGITDKLINENYCDFFKNSTCSCSVIEGTTTIAISDYHAVQDTNTDASDSAMLTKIISNTGPTIRTLANCASN